MAHPVVSRRALLTSARVVTLGGSLASCRLDPASSDARASSLPSGPTSTVSAGVEDPDLVLVDAARAELGGLLSHLAGGPSNAANRDLIAFHTVQLGALGGTAPTTTRRRLTQAALVRRERHARDRFLRWAEAARSGELARVLAAVAAGISMQPLVREPTS